MNSTNRHDSTGKEIKFGDVFELENLYIIMYNPKTGEFFVQEYENQVEYGVEEEPYYLLKGIHKLEEYEFEKDTIRDNIFKNKELLKQLHRSAGEKKEEKPAPKEPFKNANYQPEKSLADFLRQFKGYNEVEAKGKDFYSYLASIIYHKPYEECQEFDSNNCPYPAGKVRRTTAKSILAAYYFKDLSYISGIMARQE